MGTLRAVVFLAASIMGFSIAPTAASAANWRRFDAAYCTPEHAMNYYYYAAGLENEGSGDEYDCPVLSDEDLNHSAVTTATIFGSDQNGGYGLTAEACIQTFYEASGACGDGAFTGTEFEGDYAMNLDVTEWANDPYGFAYIYVLTCDASFFLPGHCTVYGYSITNG